MADHPNRLPNLLRAVRFLVRLPTMWTDAGKLNRWTKLVVLARPHILLSLNAVKSLSHNDPVSIMLVLATPFPHSPTPMKFLIPRRALLIKVFNVPCNGAHYKLPQISLVHPPVSNRPHRQALPLR